MYEIYLDHASTTPIRSEVLEAMIPYLTYQYGNPSGIHNKAHNAYKELENARTTIADLCGVKKHQVIFTSGGTEANNLAILGYCRANKSKGNHIITSQAEHPSVQEVFRYLESHEGFEVEYLHVNNYGQVNPNDLKAAITDQTIFCSIIHANSEIGSINDITALSKICKKQNIIFHTDMCQTAGYEEINIQKLKIDMMTLNSSKIYGPKGVGCLVMNDHIEIQPLLWGGSQEHNLRAGTQNVPGIIGFSKALELAQQEKEEEKERLIDLRDWSIQELQKKIPTLRYNGDPIHRVAHNIHISIPGRESEAIIMYLSESYMYISSGTSCSNKDKTHANTLEAIGLSKEEKESSLRITLGKYTQKKDMETFINKLYYILKSKYIAQ